MAADYRNNLFTLTYAPPPDSASVLACAITIYCGFRVSKIPRQAHE